MGLFGNRGNSGLKLESARVVRSSSGWAQLRKLLESREGLRILDVGATSAGNINLITRMGHSIYMANLAAEAARPEWRRQAADVAQDPAKEYDVEGFLAQNLDFAGREFDVVLLFDALDYIPQPLVQPIVDRVFTVLQPGGNLLAFFHGKMTGEETLFSRYHLTEGDTLDLQRTSDLPLLHNFSTRQVEQLFHNYASSRFFLAKDALREVLITR